MSVKYLSPLCGVDTISLHSVVPTLSLSTLWCRHYLTPLCGVDTISLHSVVPTLSLSTMWCRHSLHSVVPTLSLSTLWCRHYLSPLCGADTISSQTLLPSLPRVKVGVPYTDFLNQIILPTWQSNRNGAVPKKLHSVNPVLGGWLAVLGGWQSWKVGSPGRLAVLLQAVQEE